MDLPSDVFFNVYNKYEPKYFLFNLLKFNSVDFLIITFLFQFIVLKKMHVLRKIYKRIHKNVIKPRLKQSKNIIILIDFIFQREKLARVVSAGDFLKNPHQYVRKSSPCVRFLVGGWTSSCSTEPSDVPKEYSKYKI